MNAVASSGAELLIEYLAQLAHPVIVVALCREQHATAICRDRPAVIFRNEAFPAGETELALRYAEGWGCSAGAGPSKPPQVGTWSGRVVGGNLLVIEDTNTDRASTLLLPTPSRPKPFPSASGDDLTAASSAALEHNELFLSRDWASSPLGPLYEWTPYLRGLVQIMMASPFPVLISYGPEYVLLYNEPYSRVIGKKHPRILGMKYGEAWPEVWGALEPVVKAGYQGQVLHVECQEMFLLRGARLEETYFSYSIIPIRDTDDKACGLYIPNFDNTVRIVTERRIRSLHEISRCINLSPTPERVIADALDAMSRSNPRDMHSALFYTAESADRDTWHGSGSDRSHRGSRGRTSVNKTRPRGLSPSLRSDSTMSSGARAAGTVFRLTGSYGVTKGDLPLEFSAMPEDGAEAASAHPIAQLVRQAREQDRAVLIPNLADIPSLQFNGNPFDDPPGAGIVLPIRSSTEDRLHGVVILGLNTRLTWDEDYSNYIQLVKGLLATGLATIKLHEEDLFRARYMAALNRQKNDELQSLLAHRTMELRNSELKFRSAFAGCPTAIWISSPEGAIWDMNHAYIVTAGMTPDGPLEDWQKRVHPDDIDHVQKTFRECRTKRVMTEFRFLPTAEELAAGMKEKWVEASGQPVYDENGVVVMLSGALLDITLRRQHLLNQTRRADEALELKQLQDHFIDMLSHELRNPLNAICLSSDGVVDSLHALTPRCSPEVAEELDDIVNDAGVIKLCTVHMRRLVDDVLALSKLDNNILIVTPIPAQPESLCQQVLQIVQSEMLTHDIICRFQIKQGYRDLDVDWAELDPSRVSQILINLLANAIKFTAPADKRVITLTLDATVSRPRLLGDPLNDIGTSARAGEMGDGDGVVNLVFEVNDTGAGMNEAEIQRLFQRFAQGSNRTHLTYGGNGLGLFICRRITQLLGGEISVHSRVAEGSTFAFFIPVTLSSCPSPTETPSADTPSTRNSSFKFNSPPDAWTPLLPSPTAPKADTWPRARRAPNGHSSPKAQPGSGNVHVLLVEDNEISQKLLRKQLMRAGCSVVTANDGVEAVEYMAKNAMGVEEEIGGPSTRVELILMDIEMPRKGGVEATQDIRAMEAAGSVPCRTPIIAVSANARSGQIQSMLDAGIDAAVSKPFKMAELLAQIEALTGKKPGRDPQVPAAE